jgi:hypothetical protein
MDTRIYDPITQGQNNGTPCPYCQFTSGHKVTCITLNTMVAPWVLAVKFRVLSFVHPRYAKAKLAPIAEPTFTEADVIALHGLGVRL